MENPLSAALIITAIGMGLVFVMILLLWGFMALLVRLTADKEETIENAGEEVAALEPVAVEAGGSELKKRAAAVAVAVARMAGGKKNGSLAARVAAPNTTNLSAWQVTMRLSQNQSRKPRGRVR